MSFSGSTTEAPLRGRLAIGETLFGAFLTLGSPLAAELCGAGGFDWVVVDLEHGAGTDADLVPQLQATARWPAFPLVRVARAERSAVTRALDAGALGIMFPRIDTVEQAREAVSYLRYPPDGVRGVASATRGALFAADAQRDPLGVIQIESETALKQTRAIAALEGVDVLFLGPSDLSAALGVTVADRRIEAAYESVLAAAQEFGKVPGVYAKGATPAELAERGFRFIAVGSDTTFLIDGIRAAAPLR